MKVVMYSRNNSPAVPAVVLSSLTAVEELKSDGKPALNLLILDEDKLQSGSAIDLNKAFNLIHTVRHASHPDVVSGQENESYSETHLDLSAIETSDSEQASTRHQLAGLEDEERIAVVCHEANRAYCATLGDLSQPEWQDAPGWAQDSAMSGVIFHLDALRKGEHKTPEESHRAWLAQKEAEGWTYGPVKNPETKEHPCFLPYGMLPIEAKIKDYIFSSIVKAFYEAWYGLVSSNPDSVQYLKNENALLQDKLDIYTRCAIQEPYGRAGESIPCCQAMFDYAADLQKKIDTLEAGTAPETPNPTTDQSESPSSEATPVPASTPSSEVSEVSADPQTSADATTCSEPATEAGTSPETSQPPAEEKATEPQPQ